MQLLFSCLNNYNIPRKIRELQWRGSLGVWRVYYNIPRKIRELQSPYGYHPPSKNYNIPRKIRELQFTHQREIELFYYNIPRKIIKEAFAIRYLYKNISFSHFLNKDFMSGVI